MNTPSKIWIAAPNREPPDWVLERMTTGDIAADGSFEMEASDGVMRAEAGFAVFMFNDQVFCCSTKGVPDKLAAAAGAEHPVVTELVGKLDADREAKRLQHDGAKSAAKMQGEKALKLKPLIGSPPTPAFALVDMLLVDDTYQRSIEGGSSQKLIVQIAENWDYRLCLPLIVSKRDGKLYVIDGQHRLEAARLRGDIRDLPCVIFDLADAQAEADLFMQANRSRRAMGTLDDFHAAVVAGDAKSVLINEVVTAAGLTVGRNSAWQYWKPGEVVFVTAIKRALTAQGRPLVEQTLAMMARAFDGVVLTGGGALFTGLCRFTAERMKIGKPIDVAMMERVLSEVGIPGWKEATEGVDSGQERADAMLRAIETNYQEAEGE